MALYNKYYILNNNRRGQSMILMVLILTGTLLSVAMISGLVMLSQIRQAGNISKSAQAIFAAETGVEWWRMSIKNPAPLSSTINSTLINESNSSFEIFPVAGNPNQTKIIGTAGSSKRAFLATVTPPSAACGPDSDVVLVLQDTNPGGGVSLLDYQNSVRDFANGLLTASPNIYIGEFAFEDPAGLKFRLENNGPLTLPIDAGLNFINAERNLSSGISRAFAELTTNPSIPPVNPTYAKNYTTTPNFIVIVAYNFPNRPLPNPLPDAKTAADAAKAAGITIIVVGVNVPVSGILEDFLMNDIASPGNYFLATGFDPIAVGELGKVLLNQVLPLIDCP